MKYLVMLIFGALCSNVVVGKQYNLHIVSCTDSLPVIDAFVIGRGGHLLGKTNATGDCLINTAQFPVYIEKEGFERQTLYDLSDNDVVCLQRKTTTLDEVNITAKKIDLAKYLLSLRDKNLALFMGKDTTLYYRFNYFWEVPGEDWKEQATGYISYQRRNIHSVFPPKIYYVQYHYSEKGRVSERFYNAASVLGMEHLKFYDIMDNTGMSLWKRLINREPKGISIPIPKFLIRKSLKKALADTSRENARRYAYVNRKLILKNIDRQQVFSTYSDADTNDINTLERLVFDENGRICTVEYFTPEQIANGSIPISEHLREQDKPFSRISSDSSYYYSRYIYATQTPGMLLKAIHIDILVKDGIYYRTKTVMDLSDTIPAENFRTDVIYTKGKEVLHSINYSRQHEEDEDASEEHLMNNPIIRKAIKEQAEQND